MYILPFVHCFDDTELYQIHLFRSVPDHPAQLCLFHFSSRTLFPPPLPQMSGTSQSRFLSRKSFFPENRNSRTKTIDTDIFLCYNNTVLMNSKPLII